MRFVFGKGFVLAASSLAFIVAACGSSSQSAATTTGSTTVASHRMTATTVARAMIASGLPARVAFSWQPANDPKPGRRGGRGSEASLDDHRFPAVSSLSAKASWRDGGAAIECYPSGSGAQRRYRVLVQTENFLGSKEGNDDVAGPCVLRLSNDILDPAWVHQYRHAFEAAAKALTGGVAASAKTAVPKQLIGWWQRGNGLVIAVGPRGNVKLTNQDGPGWSRARFSRVRAHRLRISGIRSCSGTGTYRWTITNGFAGPRVAFKEIHDACKPRVGLFEASDWGRYNG